MSTVDLAGVWRLVSYYDLDDDGLRSEGPLGPDPRGLLIYGDDGFLSVNMMRPDATSVQIAYLGYAGTWRRSDDDETELVHRIEVCSNPVWADTEQTRRMSFDGELLTLTGTAIVAGRPQNRLLTWRRASLQTPQTL
jgi:lipocalin-like protein